MTNLEVGDDETPGSPFWPAGDFFLYADTLDFGPGLANLVDLNGLEDQGFSPDPWSSITLRDPTGTAFSSQALPTALPLGAFANTGGIVHAFDDNSGETLYSVSFRIDSIFGCANDAGRLGLRGPRSR